MSTLTAYMSFFEIQKNFYEKKSKKYKKCYLTLKTFQIIFIACIPFISGLINEHRLYLVYFIGVLALLSSIIEGVLALNKFQDKWIQYRSVSQNLSTEKNLFENKVAPYDKVNADKIFVQNIERILTEEHETWNSVQQKTQN